MALQNTALKTSGFKVLRNSAGKALRQNYQFGKGIGSLTGSYSYPIVIDNIHATDVTLIFWANALKAPLNTGGLLRFTFAFDDGTSKVQNHYYTDGNYFGDLGSIQFVLQNYVSDRAQVPKGTYLGTRQYVISFSAGTFRHIIDNTILNVGGTPNVTSPLKSITIAAALSLSSFIIGEIAIYKRQFTQRELDFNYNNRSGNFLLNPSGLWSHIQIGSLAAPVLQPDGTTKAGFLDQSGNGNNASLSGLPAAASEQAKCDSFNSTYVLDFLQ